MHIYLSKCRHIWNTRLFAVIYQVIDTNLLSSNIHTYHVLYTYITVLHIHRHTYVSIQVYDIFSIPEFLAKILRCFYATGKTCLVPQHLVIIARLCSLQRLLPPTDFITVASEQCHHFSMLLFIFLSARCLPACC